MSSTVLTKPIVAAIPPGKERLYYLDNLRAFIILVVIVFHVAMAFMVFVPSWWPVIDPQLNIFFTAVVLLTDVPIMPIMFMIAGYFALASLARKGQAVFWRDKLLRIVFPWILGFLVIAPLSPYFWLISRMKDPPKFSYFWTHMFFTKQFNTQGALWFLGVLTVFYLGLSLAYALYKPLGDIVTKAEKPDFSFWLAFLLFTSTVFVTINQFWFDFQWVPVKYVLWLQPTRISLEAFYFILGVYAYRKQWFATGGYRPKIGFWIPAALITSAVFFAYKMKVGFLMPTVPVRGLHALLHCFFCLASTLALVGFFQRYLNRTGPLLGRLALGSYAIYWVHMPVVSFSNLVIRGYHWNIFLKYAAASTLAVVISYVIGAYILTLLPMFGRKKISGGAPQHANPEVAELAEEALTPVSE